MDKQLVVYDIRKRGTSFLLECRLLWYLASDLGEARFYRDGSSNNSGRISW